MTRLICSTSRWRESPVSRELRSCAVVGVEARRGVIEPVRVDTHQEARREGLAEGFAPQRTLRGRLAALLWCADAPVRIPFDCGARTPPSASPSTPHLGPRPGMRTRSSAHQEREPVPAIGGEHALWGLRAGRWDAAGVATSRNSTPHRSLPNVAPSPFLFAADVQACGLTRLAARVYRLEQNSPWLM